MFPTFKSMDFTQIVMLQKILNELSQETSFYLFHTSVPVYSIRKII